jgi:tRNA threonylcarbamoyladenosine biosynthesis protein TsaB
MALLLCIDTSTTHASVALARDEELLSIKVNQQQKDHASFLQPAIKEIMHETKFNLTDIKAIAVTSGPGSYTGLRVGFSSAKGLCYALQIPLIAISTTEVMSAAALQQINRLTEKPGSFFLCPMIDARRMEVFTAVYSSELKETTANTALVLESDSFSGLLQAAPVYFFGNGADKWKSICMHQNARFIDVLWDAKDMIRLANAQFNSSSFTSLAYSTPDYGKDFHTAAK